MSGVLAARRRIPGAFIERIWIRRITPFTLHNGKRVMRNRWITLLDSRSGIQSFIGWTGVQKSGYSDDFREMMRNLRHSHDYISVADVLKETAAKNGYGNLSIKCCPQCGSFILRTQCCCLHCGMSPPTKVAARMSHSRPARCLTRPRLLLCQQLGPPSVPVIFLR